MVIETDILIIGAGVAGLSTAIKIAEANPSSEILILTKTNKQESNTRWAQGGIAAVWDFSQDNFDKHIADTLDAGDGLCDEEIVKIVVEEGHDRVKEIIDWGARFDKEESGHYDLGKEGGHTENRILHYKDITGWEILRSLIAKAKTYANITIKEHFFAIEIITQHHMGHYVTRLTPDIQCYGVYVLNKEDDHINTILAKSTVMCTGGGGQVYRNTTNPTIATGDGIAMMYRACGRIINMEFVQFHPTALFNPQGENPDFLISEAVRGEGAVLRTVDGKRFMQKYDDRLSLAPRDIVARAIDKEIKTRGDEYVYLDCSPIDAKTITQHFPNIYEKCKSLGIDILKGDMIPVLPACHYMCGGIWTDQYGRTSIKNLYAAGECTSSGLHGANRLASNSLLEGLVFGHRVATVINQQLPELTLIKDEILNWDADGTTHPKEMVLLTQSWKELKEIMSNYVGIVRTNTRLKRALDRIHLLYTETEQLYQNTVVSPQLCELRNLITIAYMVTKSAQIRKESRGLHFNTDYPDRLDYLETVWM
jgi:L-aspartate oxidase